MEVLITGNVKAITNEFCQHLAYIGKLVISGDIDTKVYTAKNVVPYSFLPFTQEFENVFRTYNFKHVIYMSNGADGGDTLDTEMSALEKVLSLSAAFGIDHVVYVTGAKAAFGGAEKNAGTSSIFFNTCNQLCQYYNSFFNLNVTTLYVPYIYTAAHYNNQLGAWIKQAFAEKKVAFPLAGTATDFICDLDLADLICRIIDEPQTGYSKMHVGNRTGTTFEQLGEAIKAAVPEVEITFDAQHSSFPEWIYDEQPRQLYGWVPMDIFADTLKELLSCFKNQYTAEKKNIFKQLQAYFAKHNVLLKALEIGVLFVICEYLTAYVNATQQISYVDIRMLFVVIVSIVHGFAAGGVAAGLACIGYIASYLGKGNDVNILFYNVENWLPFVSYLLAGSITGFIKDKHKDKEQFMTEQQQLLENKYVFLNELYLKALENKEQFNSQILSYRDSYGRIYDVVKKLNNMLPDAIFSEAVSIIEEILNTNTVAIYSVEKGSSFARLNVCSKDISAKLTTSTKLDNFPRIFEDLSAGKIWFNSERLRGYPDYCAPIYQQQTLVGLIFILHSAYEQMTIEYVNKFNILSEMISASLIRAMEYDAMTAAATLLPGTRILRAEQFEKVLAIKREMREKSVSDYVLVKVEKGGRTLTELSDLVNGAIRHADVLGQGEDGTIYLLLAQTKMENIGLVKSRMLQKGIIITEAEEFA
ncbi:MAG: hypothetical protein PHG02_06955 [Oscillospiraceae bacterium]|nr:hypothetical protein [Oscillospiraceae bacterium]